MSLSQDEERWRVWTVQARRFAKRENYVEAAQRMRLVAESIEEALSKETDPSRRARIERHRTRAREYLGDLESQAAAWTAAIAARRQETIDQAAQEMAKPLPLEPDQR